MKNTMLKMKFPGKRGDLSCTYGTLSSLFIGMIMFNGPVAQSAERCTPRGESTRPGYNSSGSKRDGRFTFMSLLTGMIAVGGRP